MIFDDKDEENFGIEDLLYFCKIKFDVFGCSKDHINFNIGKKEYVLKIHEVKDGEHWSEK